MKQSTVVALLTLVWGAGLGLAQENEAKSPAQEKAAERREPSPDLDAIRAGSEAFVVAVNNADAKAGAAMRRRHQSALLPGRGDGRERL